MFCEVRFSRLAPRNKRKTRSKGAKLCICRRNIGLREIAPDGRLGVGSGLMFQPGGDVDYTTKDEGECGGCEDQDYIEGDEERPRS